MGPMVRIREVNPPATTCAVQALPVLSTYNMVILPPPSYSTTRIELVPTVQQVDNK